MVWAYFWTGLAFAALALAAMAFAVAPVMRLAKPAWARAALAGAIALFLLGVGGGTYLMLGQPALALRSLGGTQTGRMDALIPLLIERTRKEPGDLRAWTFLGSVYLSENDPADAAMAFARAVTVARLNHMPSAVLYSAYGEALVKSEDGAVGDEAVAAFNAALALDHRDAAARYYLGLAAAMHGDNARAIALWQSLLADLPPNAPQHPKLLDQLAALTARTGQAPDINAMVEGLAARLKQNPNDAEGWQRLIRAYAVLGEKNKALAALASARNSVPSSRPAFEAEAAELKLR